MGQFFINRSSKDLPVWTYGANCPGYDKTSRRGTLRVREFYRYEDMLLCDGYPEYAIDIRFLSSNYGFTWGYLHGDDVAGATGYNTSVLAIPLYTVSINGTSHKVYQIQNRSEELRRADGTLIGTLAVGTEIATNSDEMGYNYLTYWLIRYVKRNGVWTPADQQNGTYAFVDTGLAVGSGPTTISIKTSLA